jgi:phosphohistidine phosphatase SixA
MGKENIWDNRTYTIQARKIISAIQEFPNNAKIILVVRHSHVRPKRLDNLDYQLTPMGREIAVKFGENLPNDRFIRLFHSSVNRCKETAEKILVGFEDIGGKGEIKGEFSPLFDIGVTPEFMLKEIRRNNPYNFFYRWVAGCYPSDNITPLLEYSQNAAHLIWKKLDSAPERGIDIHISHDLHVLALRLGWFGFPLQKKWISYIGGLALVFQKDQILVSDIDRLVSIDYPYWFKR